MELSLTSKFEVENLVITPEEIIKNYLFGIPLISRDGRNLPKSTIVDFIKQSQREVERYLSIKLFKSFIKETKTYFVDDWIRWGYIKTTYPISCPRGLFGYYNNEKSIKYPENWLSVRRTNTDEVVNRNLYLVPLTNSQTIQLTTTTFPANYIGFWNNIRNGVLPNYWEISYITGFEKVPLDLVSLIGKMVSIQLLPILSDSFQKTPGVSSSSLSLDGLSQSTSLYANSTAGIYGARIKQYSEEVKNILPLLKDTYCGIIWDVA